MSQNPLRQQMRAGILADPDATIERLSAIAALSLDDRAAISDSAAELVRQIRQGKRPGLTETFLAQYGLSTDEGVALMCLAEALLRVPDTETIDALIEDKIAPSDWGRHLGQSASSLVNASTWALLLTGKVLDPAGGDMAGTLRAAIRRVGEPLIRRAVQQAMRELGTQFVLGQTIAEASANARKMQKRGYSYSYDMLGEAARTDADAQRYHLAYADAISALAPECTADDIARNPGISVKLSALHPRYEALQRDRVLSELLPRVLSLALLAKSAGMGFNIDAEEADRLDLSLDIIEALIASPSLRDWNGLGVVVQAYGLRCAPLIDWLAATAKEHDRRIMVRLVKGAYWDTEIKRAQTLGLSGYPVFTRKCDTDISYIANARKLLSLRDVIYPQFATHNAHSVAAILHMAGDRKGFEFQRLHGMGEALHDTVLRAEGTHCRIYAPVGAHRDLLAYLVRRLLENGANSSFVNQIVDTSVTPQEIAADPFLRASSGVSVPLPSWIFSPRRNSAGHDLTDPLALQGILEARQPFLGRQWQASGAEAAAALKSAQKWRANPAERAAILERASDLFEAHLGEIFALLADEARKTLPDCVSELREAVDFLRYYASQAIAGNPQPEGTFVCIAPWNFPLAIFTGQIAAALAAGNAVIAKPAPQTPRIAQLAVGLLHEAGVPLRALQLVIGGAETGALLTADKRVDGIAFTGSTVTAQRINKAMAATGNPSAMLIAETGGINAMIVDSTALPEQAVRDILASAFQSAGQRCSALRMLYLQSDIEEPFLEMLTGAMRELKLGDPADPATDIGPVIDAAARARIVAHIELARSEGRLLFGGHASADDNFIEPALIRVWGIASVETEVFGPVLHVATFEADAIGEVADAINASGYGLTFGLHSRIDGRVQTLVERVHAGNIYVNRNQIGAVVGAQPFGGEALSGTGPKAGGPHYMPAFAHARKPQIECETHASPGIDHVQTAIDTLSVPQQALGKSELPGPTGESNTLTLHARGIVLCLGPDAISAMAQAQQARAGSCPVIAIAPGLDPENAGTDEVFFDGLLDPAHLAALQGFAAAALWTDPASARPYRQALASRDGPILPLIMSSGQASRYLIERHLCIDTTAAGGNASLLSGGPD